MKKPFVLLFSLILFMLMNISSAHAVNNPRNIYDVKPGDSLWKISSTYLNFCRRLEINKRIAIGSSISWSEIKGSHHV